VTDRKSVWFYPLSTGHVFPAGLNNRDETTGQFFPPEANGTYQPAIFRLSGVERIPLPPGGVSGGGWDINDSAHVVGGYTALVDGSEVGRGFFYHDGMTMDLPVGMVALNNFDEAIGSSGEGAFVFINEKTYLLSESIRPNSDFAIQQVKDINNDGVIAGSAVRNGQERAVVLIPLNRNIFRKHSHSPAAHRVAWWTRAMSPKQAADF
jgi:hypothetical protein